MSNPEPVEKVERPQRQQTPKKRRAKKNPAPVKKARQTTDERLVEQKVTKHIEAPDPFRPSDLRRMIEEYAKENGVEPGSIKPYHFRKEHGLPNPTCLIAVQQVKGSDGYEITDFEAVDTVDAINQYVMHFGVDPGEAAKSKFETFVKES